VEIDDLTSLPLLFQALSDNDLLRFGVKVLLQRHAELLTEGLGLLEVLSVLALVLDLGLETLEDADSGSKVVDPPGSLESSDDDGGRGNEIVSEGVVEIALELENVLNTIKLLLEPGGELLKGLFSVLASSGHRSGEVGNGRAGHKGLHGRSDGSSADAASDTDEGGHFGRRRRRELEW
jgi:hypothetical protein